MSAEQRLLAKAERDLETGCLRWTGGHTPKGYGRIKVDGRDTYVHRVAHEVWIGPIPEGHDVDHVADRGCVHRDCFEPTHLEAVTRRENLLRSAGFAGNQSRQTHCKRSHPLVEGNLIRNQYGERRCATCNRERNRLARARKATP